MIKNATFLESVRFQRIVDAHEPEVQGDIKALQFHHELYFTKAPVRHVDFKGYSFVSYLNFMGDRRVLVKVNGVILNITQADDHELGELIAEFIAPDVLDDLVGLAIDLIFGNTKSK